MGLEPGGMYERGYPHGSGFSPGSHFYYSSTPICTAGGACTVQAVGELIRQYPTPSTCVLTPGCDPKPVSTGDRSFAWPVGTVTHTVRGSVVLNQTLEGHLLHDGMVVRCAAQRGGMIYVDSIGFGRGDLPGPNASGASFLWGFVDSRIQARFR
jgi:hypothetical protein